MAFGDTLRDHKAESAKNILTGDCKIFLTPWKNFDNIKKPMMILRRNYFWTMVDKKMSYRKVRKGPNGS